MSPPPPPPSTLACSDLEEQRCSPGRFVSRESNSHLSLSHSPPKMQCFCDFWVLRCRLDLIDREKYRNPRSMNFQRATAHFARHCRLQYWMEKILFSLFSVRVSLSLVDLSVRPSRGTTVTAVGAAEQVQKLLAEKGGSIGNDAFCPVMNYGEGGGRRRYREMRRSVAVHRGGHRSRGQNCYFVTTSQLPATMMKVQNRQRTMSVNK